MPELTCLTPLLYTQVQYQRGTGGSYVEKPAETLRLASAIASHSVRSGGREFESPVRRELGALTKSGKTLVVRSFYNINIYVPSVTVSAKCAL